MAIVGYYALTPLFAMLDAGFDLNLRLSFLGAHDGWRTLYYGICLLCLGLMLWQPGMTALTGAIESLITIVALIFMVAERSLFVTDALIEGGTPPLSFAELVNFILSGAVAYLAWTHSLRQIAANSSSAG